MVEAAREVGNGFLEMGNIPRAWPYFRAIGEPGPVVEAMEQSKPAEDQVDALIAIAFQEGVAPAKGLEYSYSKPSNAALTTFGMYCTEGPRGSASRCSRGNRTRRLCGACVERD